MKIEFDLNDEYTAKLAFVKAENHSHGGTITDSELCAAFVAAVLDDDDKAHRPDNQWAQLKTWIKQLKWRSVEKDNMEYEVRTTCFVKEALEKFASD